MTAEKETAAESLTTTGGQETTYTTSITDLSDPAILEYATREFRAATDSQDLQERLAAVSKTTALGSASWYALQRLAREAKTTLDKDIKYALGEGDSESGGGIASLHVPVFPLRKPLSNLLDSVAAFYRRFVILSEAQLCAWALWTAHTYVVDAAGATPFMTVTSAERESGKTRLLEVTELLVREPVRAASMSPAALYTKITESTPTLLLDELDAVFSPKAKGENEELRGLLNAGNRRGATTFRCIYEKGKRATEELSVFCPRALAGIGRLPETIESRSILIRLKRKKKHETVERLGPRELRAVRPEAERLREALRVWGQTSIEALLNSEPVFPPGLRDRQEESAEPLLAIADCAGSDWPVRARTALLELCGGEAVQESSIGERLLRDCKSIFEQRSESGRLEGVRIFSGDLRLSLCAIEEAPWATWSGGKEINARGLAQLLKPYGIESKDLRIGDERAKGFEAAAFEDAWERYLGVVASPSSASFDPRQARQTNTGAAFQRFSIPRQAGSVSDRQEAVSSTRAGLVSDVSDKPSPEGAGGQPCRFFVGPNPSGNCQTCTHEFSAHLTSRVLVSATDDEEKEW